MKRREFIKSVVASGAAPLVAAPLVRASELAPLAASATRNKTLFVSDIHLNVNAAYTWISPERLAFLAQFLAEVNQRPDVAELVILGDFVDDWVVPVLDAPHSFDDILSDPVNKEVVATLQSICKNPEITVTYLTGNHDLLSWQLENKTTLKRFFPQMVIVSEYPGNGSWSKNNVIWAEHGHRYCLFNAADVWSEKPSQLPLGYFMSRLAATASVNQHQTFNTLDLLRDLGNASEGQLLAYLEAGGWTQHMAHSKIDKGIHDDALIKLIYYGEAAWANTKPRDLYVMNNLDGFSTNPSVWSIGQSYGKILSRWPVRQGLVPGVIALGDDLGQLANAAEILFRMPARLRNDYPFVPKIILFGHTHRALIQHNTTDQTIYINTGTWIDGKPMTYAEVATTPDAGALKYTATLYDYGAKTVLGEASLTV